MRQVLKGYEGEDGLGARKRFCYSLNNSTQDSQETHIELDDIDPSAADTVHNDQHQSLARQSNQSEEAARVKRNEIRCAHRYLHEHAEPGLFQVDPLPSTWSTENEDRFDTFSEGKDADEHDSFIPGQQESVDLAPASEPNTPTKFVDLTGDGTMSPRPLNTQQTDSQQTDILTLSISESALDSPGQVSLSNENPNQDSLARSRRARVAAYLAAREDTFSAWADVSLVSGGDNHADEEIEL
jgi:DNA cross-link repair 1C protein